MVIYKIVDCLQEVLLTMDASFSVLVLTIFKGTVYNSHSNEMAYSKYRAQCS